MSKPIKGSLQRIVSLQLIPSTSRNKNVKKGGQMLLKLGCGHEKTVRASTLNRNNRAISKKAQCWICANEAVSTTPI